MALLSLSIRPPCREQNPLGYLLCTSFVLSPCQAFCRHSVSGIRLSYLLWLAKISFLYPGYLVCLFFFFSSGAWCGVVEGKGRGGDWQGLLCLLSPEWHRSCSGFRSDMRDPWESETITLAHQTFAALRKNPWYWDQEHSLNSWWLVRTSLAEILCLNLACSQLCPHPSLPQFSQTKENGGGGWGLHCKWHWEHLENNPKLFHSGRKWMGSKIQEETRRLHPEAVWSHTLPTSHEWLDLSQILASFPHSMKNITPVEPCFTFVSQPEHWYDRSSCQ